MVSCSTSSPQLLHTWGQSDGLFCLYYRQKTKFYYGELHRGIKKIFIDHITGLPQKEYTPEQWKEYGRATYCKLRPTFPEGYHVYLNTRGKGGMLRHKIAEIEQTSDIFSHIVPTPLNFVNRKLDEKMQQRGDEKFKILSIDGGGLRGVIPLVVLRELEVHIGPASETFDLIGGTSTGGIIALGLANPINPLSAEELLEIYQTKGEYIFKKRKKTAVELATSLCSLGIIKDRSLQYLYSNPLYSHKGMQQIAAEIFHESIMKDAKTNLLIPSVNLTDEHNPRSCFFNCQEEEYSLLSMQDVALATSAAPTYFRHKRINGLTYVDGGLTHNNPAYRCHLHALKYLVPTESQVLFSLGTGFADIDGIPGRDRHNLFYWAKQMFPTIEKANKEEVDENLRFLLKDQYLRLNPSMEEEIGLDDVKAIPELVELGEKLVADKEEEIRKIARKLRPEKFD